jgi:hypothetical protein
MDGTWRDNRIKRFRQFGFVLLGVLAFLPLEVVLGMSVLAAAALAVSRDLRMWVVR